MKKLNEGWLGHAISIGWWRHNKEWRYRHVRTCLICQNAFKGKG